MPTLTTRFTTAVNDASGGYAPYSDPAWQNPANALTANDDAASVTPIDSEVTTNWLKLTDLEDKLPLGAIPDGVEFCIKAKGTDAEFGGVVITNVQLSIDGVVGSADRAVGGGPNDHFVNNGPAVTKTYGGANDTFGASLDRDDINDSGFGVGITITGAGGSDIANIVFVDVTIHYH